MVQQRWTDAAAAVAFEELDPVSVFPVVPGRRWGPGLWWSATTEGHMASGSNAVRVQLMVLDRDPQMVGMAGRPVRLLWREGRGRVRSWVPQLFARYAAAPACWPTAPVTPGRWGTGHDGRCGAGGGVCAGGIQLPAPGAAGRDSRGQRAVAGRLSAPASWGRAGLLDRVVDVFARPRPLVEGQQRSATRSRCCPLWADCWWRHWRCRCTSASWWMPGRKVLRAPRRGWDEQGTGR
ncbi:TnsA-like heteromeric transposase endonuclease subunit [Streptomyces alboflavus]|uniref:TnsA-like heteromeric transposase endonuclease subunit n=1 Tax=Streptomyces alboflavus TaxID=67267 RepID=UPI001F490CE2|nr:TnsA-like heteromeric transposase endonuclease subunit [Streptomyces alboflavus]